MRRKPAPALPPRVVKRHPLKFHPTPTENLLADEMIRLGVDTKHLRNLYRPLFIPGLRQQ
jgi:hypothetical protein